MLVVSLVVRNDLLRGLHGRVDGGKTTVKLGTCGDLSAITVAVVASRWIVGVAAFSGRPARHKTDGYHRSARSRDVFTDGLSEAATSQDGSSLSRSRWLGISVVLWRWAQLWTSCFVQPPASQAVASATT